MTECSVCRGKKWIPSSMSVKINLGVKNNSLFVNKGKQYKNLVSVSFGNKTRCSVLFRNPSQTVFTNLRINALLMFDLGVEGMGCLGFWELFSTFYIPKCNWFQFEWILLNLLMGVLFDLAQTFNEFRMRGDFP